MFRLASALPSFRGGNNSGECYPKASLVSTEEADQVPPLSTATPANPSQATTPTQSIQSIPPWVREINNSRVSRHSRASSIVSTQTKFTTTTLQEDARSIDINVGGQYFRISRDGSSVTADAPPPYTGPGEVVRFRGGRVGENGRVDRRPDLDDEDEDENETDLDEPEDGAITPRSALVPLDSERGVRANILDPTEFEMPSPVGYDRLNHRSSSATLVQHAQIDRFDTTRAIEASFDQGRDILSAPGRQGQGRRAASHDDTSTLQHLMPQSSPLRRTNGVRLFPLITSSNIPRATHRPQRARDLTSPGRPLQVRSAGAILGTAPANLEPMSPDYIGRNARGAFPFPIRAATAQNPATIRNRGLPMGEVSTLEDARRPHDDNNTPLAMDDENDISLHYARMMRTLDSAHRKALHFKDKQVSELREKLNEKDIVLRQQLRAKDFIIDDLKKRLDNLEENVESLVERARHQVEDLWEARWKDRDFHLRERMRRIEEDAQRKIDQLRVGQGRSGAALMSPP